MNRFNDVTKPMLLSAAIGLVVLAAGCGGGGGRDPILGVPVPPMLIDETRPRVTVTVPVNLAASFPANSKITATFTERMAPASINAGSFTLTTGGAPVAGLVNYDVNSRTAIFGPAALISGSVYTATIKGIGASPATDLVGNALAGNQAPLPAASDYVWTFTAGAADATAPTVTLTSPAALATGVVTNAAVHATFSKPMDPLTISVTTFTLSITAGASVTGAVAYDSLTRIATFTPSSNLAPSTNYTATVTAGAKDLAGNVLVVPAALPPPNPWTFTTGLISQLAPGAPALGRAGTYGILATSATTSTGATLINGDVALNPGSSQGIPPTQVNGTIHVDDQVAKDAQTDLLVAYNSAKGLAPGTTITAGADLGAVVIPTFAMGHFPPGTYTSGTTMLISTAVVLDGGGDSNAVWIFQIGSSLTTDATLGSVSLINGAQAKNVFWVPTAAATIGVNTTFQGNILAGGDVTGQTGAVINGRMFAGAIGAATIALDANTVNVPAP